MPLTDKGKKIMKNMKDQYGADKGEEVFYASENKGTIKGVHKKSEAYEQGFSDMCNSRGVDPKHLPKR